jgi:phthiocerol/phenolphthiocerol synthesis type-I polyketide synthase C
MSDGAIAIVGASCRFPGAAGLEAFWRLLIDGVDAVSEISPDRWSTRFFHHPTRGEPGKTYSWAAGLIDGIDQFEPGFFGISPREAAEMDPQQRLLLELAWHALEDAGIPAARLAGTATGVYIGASSTDYGDLRLGDPASGGPYFVAGLTLSILANRISHVFDLRGPSLAIDTACSSSLVALHEACEALRSERVDAALVGGVNLLLSPYPFIGFAQAGMLSRRGRCFAFGARADGYVRGEGGGIVVLKRLERALSDGDPIRAVIRGTAVSASGRTMGLSLPSETTQAELLRGCYRAAGIAPDRLAFVEMHGIGTPAGDPVEAAAVGRVLGEAREEALPIGSVKTNIGHLEPASGIAGLLKAVLALQHGVLPRSLYGETLNPNIPFDRLNLRLATGPQSIAADRIAGVNSFGFGGSNAHAILAAPPSREVEPGGAAPPLIISARSPASLQALARQWRDGLIAEQPERASLLLRAAARRRDHHPHRLVMSGDDLGAALGDFLAGRANAAVVAGTATGGRLAFVFSGNGAQFLGMGGTAYRASPAFRSAIAEADAALAPFLGWSVGERVAGGIAVEDLRRADVAQPMLFAIQVAITTALRGIGVAPAGFVGHSVGEIAAAWAAGALSLDNAARIVAARSRHQERTRGTGRMAALGLGETEVRAMLGELANGLEIAAINSTHSVTAAGDAAAIADLVAEASRRGVACRVLDLDFAFHSSAMEPIHEPLLADLARISSAMPIGELVSTVTGQRVTTGTPDANHWWRNIREPVRFAAAIDVLITDGYRIFVEIGPNPVLLPYLREALRAVEPAGRVVATLDRRAGEGDPFPTIAAHLHVAGHDVSGTTWFDGPNDPRGLPLYPWQRERFWFDRTVEAVEQVNPIFDHKLLGFRQSGSPESWVNHLDTTLFPFLADHRVDGTPVLAAAAIVDMALAAARTRHPDAAILELRDVELLRPMIFDGSAAREVRSTLLPDSEWQVASRKRLADEPMTVHATARVVTAAPGRMLSAIDHAGEGEGRLVSGADLYRRAARCGLDYGESFRTVREVVVTDSDRVTVTLASVPTADFLIAPTLLDGAFQGLLALLVGSDADEAGLLPRRIGQMRAVAPFGRASCRAELQVMRRGLRSAAANIALYDEAGGLVAELIDCGFARVDVSRSSVEHFLRVELVPAPLAPVSPPHIFDRLPEILPRLADERSRHPSHQAEQALLFEALLAAIAGEVRRETNSEIALPEPLLGLLQRFGEADLPDSGDLWRSLLADYPEMVNELALVAVLGDGAYTFDAASPQVAALRRASPPVAAGRAVITAALDEIGAQWPRDRPLRIRELGTTQLCDRLHRSGISAMRVGENEPCDLALCVEAGALDVARQRVLLAPGGLLLAIMPLPNPLWELIFGRVPDWRVELAAAGLIDIGATAVARAPWPCEAIWARASANAEEAPPVAAQSLSLISDGADAGFAEGLEALGHRVVLGETDGDAIVLAVAGGGDLVERPSRLLPLFARVAAAAAERLVPLWLVTSGAQQVGGDGGEIGAALWSFARVLRNETPGLTLRSVDMPADMTGSERARCFAEELTAAGAETEIVRTSHGRRHVLRLRPGLPAVWSRPGDAVVASNERPGQIDCLGWSPAQTPGPGEIEIEVRASGINFRDVMAAAGLLPEDALLDGFAGATLGLECAGLVTAIGEGVAAFAVGDRFAGFAPQAMASRVVTRADAVIAIPPGMGFVAAATLPVAFVTARYSLVTLAQLMPGETVLIHAASGGVGLAAIQIAKGCGATVIATAGSPAKRAFLRLVGADHVCDSRELRFVASVREATGGAGVDVVLNSLHGEAMEASLELLKPFGRFIELGKRDFYENRRLHARPLRRNISYFAVDVDQLPVRRPELAKRLLGEIATALAAGEIRPLAHRCFPFAEIADAFRLMQAAQHIGKLVLVPDGNAGIAVSRRSRVPLRRDGGYVVTGGLTGFGFAVARWLAEHGAGHVALIGRRGEKTPGAIEHLAELEALGAAVTVHAVDVGDGEAVGAALAAMRRGRADPWHRPRGSRDRRWHGRHALLHGCRGQPPRQARRCAVARSADP